MHIPNVCVCVCIAYCEHMCVYTHIHTHAYIILWASTDESIFKVIVTFVCCGKHKKGQKDFKRDSPAWKSRSLALSCKDLTRTWDSAAITDVNYLVKCRLSPFTGEKFLHFPCLQLNFTVMLHLVLYVFWSPLMSLLRTSFSSKPHIYVCVHVCLMRNHQLSPIKQVPVHESFW